MGLLARQQIGAVTGARIFSAIGTAATGEIRVMSGLSPSAWLRFAMWLAIGLTIYFVYGYRNSVLRRGTTSPVTEEPS